MNSNKTNTVFARVKEIFGSDDNIAEVFNIKRQAVFYWKRKGIPSKRAFEVQEKTQGKISAIEVLRGY